MMMIVSGTAKVTHTFKWIHISVFDSVNKSGDREITILGIPETISFFNIYTTNESSFFEKKKKIRPKDGKISFKLNGASFVSLFSNED